MNISWTRMSADEAAEIIQHNDMVAFSGFTPAGSPKACLSLLPVAPANNMKQRNRIKFAY